MGEPVKIVLHRRARPGAGEAFQSWVRAVLRSAPAVEGSSVIAADGGCHFILLRFADRSELERWQSADDVRALLARGHEIAEEPGAPVVHSGLETWFALPGRAAASAPAKWKMALVTWLALLPQVAFLAEVIPHELPFLVRVVLSTAIPVALLTWVVMPRLTSWLRRWLYPLRPLESED